MRARVNECISGSVECQNNATCTLAVISIPAALDSLEMDTTAVRSYHNACFLSKSFLDLKYLIDKTDSGE